MIWPTKDVLNLESLEPAFLEEFLAFAQSLEGSEGGTAGAGRTVALLFFESSTRTRVSFEMAAKRTGAEVTVIDVSNSSLSKGETLQDTLQTFEAMGIDAVVVRHPHSGVLDQAAAGTGISVVNAGDGMHEHPTQGLLDLYTLWRRFGRLRGLHVAIIGDIAHSRVARSNIHGLTKLGARVTAVGPATLLPPGLDQWGVRVTTGLEEVLPEADVLYVLRLQRERMQRALIPSMGDFAKGYQINGERLRRTKRTCVVMHPGPMNRGVEIDDEAADGPRSLIREQVKNGVTVRMAVLAALFNRKSPRPNPLLAGERVAEGRVRVT